MCQHCEGGGVLVPVTPIAHTLFDPIQTPVLTSDRPLVMCNLSNSEYVVDGMYKKG